MQSIGNASKTQKLFGTDGIRGLADRFPLDGETVQVIGGALARTFEERLGRPARIVIGRDTRESGERIEAAFSLGARHAGATVCTAGVIPTPGIAYIAGTAGYDAGVVISASHNPFADNGIKVFLPDGRKLDAVAEEAIEVAVSRNERETIPVSPEPGVSLPDETHDPAELQSKYLAHLREYLPGLDLAGLSIVIDTANGAASAYAPSLFRGLGASVTAINTEPNGRNINDNCGSLHMGALSETVKRAGADVGIAFDGDADRVLFVDENGQIMDGDAVLWAIGTHMLAQGELESGRIIATVMSNVGLEIALRERGIELVRTDVGDKYVLDELLRSGAEIGGEQSGHIIFPKDSLVGDGMLTAIRFLAVLTRSGGRSSGLASGFTRYPQLLVNVRVATKTPFNEVPAIVEMAAAIDTELSGKGRLLLRYSGTESLARVMIEGQDQAEIERLAQGLADVIKEQLG